MSYSNMNNILQKLIQDFGDKEGVILFDLLQNKQYEDYIDIVNQLKQK